jgi:glucose/arabinose dehydrogenase
MRERKGRRCRREVAGVVGGVIALGNFSAATAQTVPAMRTVTVASGLTRPVFVTAPPADYERLFIVEQQVGGVGQIRIVHLDTGTLNSAPFLTVAGISTGNEEGLLGLAFDPNYSGNGKFYIHCTDASGAIVVKQYQVSSSNADLADTTSATIKSIITFSHPQSNHNAGWIGFSLRPNDDHNLYIASGDGGNGDDQGTGHHEPGGNAQWTGTLLGKMLRLHIDPIAGTYTIPADNPFASSNDSAVKKEIWLRGLRNPYRDSFDRGTGRMFIGDVGQSSREEIDVQQPSNPGGGENYGWRDREGFIQNPTYATATPTPTPVPPRVDPILDYPRSGSPPNVPLSGTTTTGGYLYRGKQIPGLVGTYVFGDYSAGKIFTLNYDGATVKNAQTSTSSFFPTSDATPVDLVNPSSFGEDANGELYICDLAGASVGQGRVYKVLPVTPNVEIQAVAKTGSGFALQGFGVPFSNVRLEAASEPDTASFGPLMTLPVQDDGAFEDSDTTNATARFYRVVYP